MGRYLICAAAVVLLAGCSLTRSESNVACQIDTECQSAFGSGSRCGTDGFCLGMGATTCTTNDQCRTALGAGFVCGGSSVCEPETSIACTDNADCRNNTQAGLGFECTPSLFCASAPLPERCKLVFPTNLLSNPSAHPGAVVLGGIFFGSEDVQGVISTSAALAVRSARNALSPGGLPMDQEIGFVACTSNDDSMNQLGIDGLESSDAAIAMARYLTDVLGAPAIVGPMTSSNVAAVFGDLDDEEAVLISPSATSVALESLDVDSPTDADPGFFWRTAITDDVQAATIAEVINRCGHTMPALAFENGPYGDGLAAGIQSDPLLTGIQSFSTLPYTGGNVPVVPLQGSNADVGVLIDANAADIAGAVATLASSGSPWAGRPLLVSDGAASAEFVTEVIARASSTFVPADGFDIVRGTRSIINTAGLVYTDFLAAWRFNFPGSLDATDVQYAAEAYDAAWMAIYGMAWSILQEGGAVTPKGLARGLRRLSDTGGQPMPLNIAAANTYGMVVGAFGAQLPRTVNISGASSELDFDPSTELLTFPDGFAPIEVWRVEDTGGSTFEIVPDNSPGCPF